VPLLQGRIVESILDALREAEDWSRRSFSTAKMRAESSAHDRRRADPAGIFPSALARYRYFTPQSLAMVIRSGEVWEKVRRTRSASRPDGRTGRRRGLIVGILG
jgi:hypothetical protein